MKRFYSFFILLVSCLLTVNVQAQTLFSEDFEKGSMPDGWTTEGNASWSIETGVGSSYPSTAGQGSYNAKVAISAYSGDATLITPEIDLSGVASAELSFMHVQQAWGSDVDELRVYYRASSSNEWTLLDGQTYTSAVASWTTEEGIALPNLSATYQIAFKMETHWGRGVGIDDVKIVQGASCAKPSGLKASNVTDNSADLSWAENGAATAWQIRLNGDDDQILDVTETSYPLTGLTALTAYTVEVRANCGGENSEWTNPVNFSTTAVAEVVGDAWSDDFEGILGWDLVNGTNTNAWALGEAVNNGGTHALYVSNDDGSSNAYTQNSAAMIYATKLLQFADGKYEFSYDWMANGESTYDYLRVALVPASVVLSAGTAAPSGFGTTALPTGWIALDGGSKLNLSSSWKNQSSAIDVEAGNYYVVLAWKNDNGGGTNPPAAVDNFSITKIACPYSAEGLAVDEKAIEIDKITVTWNKNAEADSWEVAWSNNNAFPAEATLTQIVNDTIFTISELESATVYYIKVRSYCGNEDFGSWCAPVACATACKPVSEYPWSENFDSYEVASSYSPSVQVLPLCWKSINKTTYSTYAVYPTVYYNSSTDYSHSTPNSLRLYSYYNSYYDYDPQDQYAILPEMDLAGKRITFWARGENATSTLKVGEMKDAADESTFNMLGEELALTTSYQKFTINLEGAGSYIAFMMDAAKSGRTTNGVYIDDILVEDVPSCVEPTGLAFVSSTTTSATFEWTNGGSEKAWDIYYATSNEAPTAETAPILSGVSEKEIADGLNPSTLYYVWVRANCGDGDYSPWMGGISFMTECAAFSAATNWSENFDAYASVSSTSAASTYPNDQMPLCWQFINRSETSGTYPQAFLTSASGYAVTGNSLFFKSSSTTPLYAVLPQFEEEISTLQLTFTYRNEGTGDSNGTLHVGYMTDPADATTFVSVLDCDRTTTLTEKDVLFTDAPAGSYIAFQYAGGSSNNYYLSIDDVLVGPIPTCVKPATPACDAKSAHTATLSWINGAEGQSAWQIAVDTIAAFNPDTLDAARLIDVTTNPATITGLAANKTHYAYVRANCDADGFSAWSKAKVTFTTLQATLVPTGLSLKNASVVSDAATVYWSGVKTNDLHASYELYYSKINALPETLDQDSLIEAITDTAYSFTGLEAETTYYVWVRDNCGEDGYSAWTSSLAFTTLANCPIPATLSVSEVEATSAKIAWEIGTNDKYNVRYRTAASELTVFTEDFENGLGDWTRRNCSSSSTITTAAAHEGANGFKFNYAYSPQYLISPELSGIEMEATLEFYYKNSSTSYTETFKVGTSSTDNATESFTFGDELSVSDGEWNLYSAAIPAGTKYICIQLTSYDKFYFYVDDVAIIAQADDAGEWQIANGTDDTKALTLTGLKPQTKYEAQVQGVCGSTETEWSAERVVFTTIASCVVPEVAEPVILPDGATISWTAGNGENRFEYACVEKDAEVTDADWILLNEDVLSITISEKASGVEYDVYVRAYCSETDKSEAVKKTFAALCPAPTALQVSNIATNSAIISWTAAEGITDYQYVVMANDAEANWANATLVEGATTASLENLEASSSYTVYVRSYYSAFAQSAAVSKLFTTNCEIFAMPFSENFNALSAGIPTCWDNAEGTTTNDSYKWTYLAAGHDGACLRFNSYNNSENNTNVLATPTIHLDKEAILSFWCKNPAGGAYEVKIAEAGSDERATLFEDLTAISDWTMKEADLSAYKDKDIIIYFCATSNWGSNDAYLYLDDVEIYEKLACATPTDVLVDNIGQTSATISWTAGSSEAAWQICLNNDEENLIDANENSFTIETLTANTAYSVKVRAICGETEQSHWSVAANFRTECGVVALPFEEGFEDGIYCWTLVDCDSGTGITTTAMEGTNGFQFKYNTMPPQYLISPELVTSDKPVKVEFYYRNYNNYNIETFKVGYSTTTNDISAFTWDEEETSAADYETWALYSDTKPAGVKYIAIQYTANNKFYLYIDNFSVVEAVPAVYNVTFAAEGAEGIVPAAQEVEEGQSIQMPVNKTLYVAGKTLTGWKAGEDTYAIGDDFTPAADVTLNAVFEDNTVDLLTADEAVIVKWIFGETAGAPSVHWEGNAGILVTQATIGEASIDVKLAIDATVGKFYNVGRADEWAQVNAGTIFAFPYKAGLTEEVDAYTNPASYTLGEGTLTVDANNYFSYLQITLPATPTALENTGIDTKAIKRLENGVLVIELNGTKYNAQGMLIRK